MVNLRSPRTNRAPCSAGADRPPATAARPARGPPRAPPPPRSAGGRSSPAPDHPVEGVHERRGPQGAATVAEADLVLTAATPLRHRPPLRLELRVEQRGQLARLSAIPYVANT